MESPAPSRPAAPAVVAVVVTHNPESWFHRALDALSAQDYPNLAVLVIDAASDTDPTDEVASVLPDAYVLRLDENPGYGAAANRVRDVVDGAAFYCFLHDDAAPAPTAVTTMVGEALRSNAAVVGAKLVEFDDPRRLLQVGEAVDKTGERSSAVERGELDQEQHDAVRDVFVVPGAATLVRSDLFDAIGGFDDGIDLLDDDLNLCWRAHVAGGRVVVAPDAVVRHVEALPTRAPEDRRRRLARHRIRTALCCYGRWHRLRVVPQMLVVSLLEVVYALVVGRRDQAADVVAAWRWNLRRRDEIRAWRERVEAFRTVPDAEIRRLQLRGSARLVQFLRGHRGRTETRSGRLQTSLQRLADGVRDGTLRWPIAAWTVTIAVVAFGSRHLVFEPIPAVGGFLPFDRSPFELFGDYLSGWRDVGLGVEAPAPTAFGLLGVLGMLFLGAMGTLREVLFLGPIALGLVGAYRFLRPTGSAVAQSAALVVYGSVPLAFDSVAAASWGSLVVYGATPWVLASMARAGRFAPFTDARRRRAPLLDSSLALGLLVALVATVEPAFVPVVALTAVGLALGSWLCGSGGAGRLAAVSAGGLVTAVVLHLPWAFDFVLPGASWSTVVGTASGHDWSLGQLLRFDVGPVGSSVLTAGIPLAAVLPLLIGRGWRFEWAVRAWTVTIVLVGTTWAASNEWLPFDLPRPETVLAPAAMALACAVGMGVRAFESDLREYGFGWRQVAAVLTGLSLLVGAVPTLLDVGNGRWYLPAGGLDRVFAFVDEEPDGFRMLWIGDPEVMPVPGHELADGVEYATTDDGLVSLTDGWPGAPAGSTQRIEDALRLASDGQMSRLGRLLAPMAVRYVVVPTAAAPRPLGGVERPAPEGLVDTLAGQLDLAEVAVNPSYVVYRNEAALPARAALEPGAGDGSSFAPAQSDLEGARRVLGRQSGDTTFEGDLDAGTRILHSATASDGWELEVGGELAPRTELFGWADGYDTETGGPAVLRYRTDAVRYVLVAVQVLLWAFVTIRTLRSRRRGAALVLPPLGGRSEEP